MGQLEGGGTARGTECRTERVAHGGERAHTGSCADGLAACMPCGASSARDFGQGPGNPSNLELDVQSVRIRFSPTRRPVVKFK